MAGGSTACVCARWIRRPPPARRQQQEAGRRPRDDTHAGTAGSAATPPTPPPRPPGRRRRARGRRRAPRAVRAPRRAGAGAALRCVRGGKLLTLLFIPTLFDLIDFTGKPVGKLPPRSPGGATGGIRGRGRAGARRRRAPVEGGHLAPIDVARWTSNGPTRAIPIDKAKLIGGAWTAWEGGRPSAQ